jgi:hypothetical protein
MPYDWVEPHEVLRHYGVSVYNAYKEDDWDEPYEFIFTTDICEQPERKFDIRESPTYNRELTVEENLKKAIEQEQITPDGVKF